MAFYKDFESKTRQEKRAQAFARGGFDDEGSHYRGQKDNKRPAGRGGRYASASGGGYQGKRPYGDKPYGEKPAYGGKSGYQGKRPYGDKPRYDGGKPKPRYDDRKGGRDYEEKRPYVQRPNRDVRSHDFGPGSRGPQNRSGFDAPARKADRGYESFRYQAPAPAIAPKPVFEEESVPAENLLAGRNPIREALKSGRDIEKLLVARGELSGSAREIVQMAREQHIPVQEVDRARLDAITRSHQGMLAFASAYQYSTVEDMLAKAEEKGEAPFLILLDGITDPHNLGAIIRSAECAGAHGVIVQERRAVGLTPAAVKASAGAVEYLPVARVTNLTAAIAKLQARNIWAYAADMDGEDYADVDFSGGVALVIGAEGEGVGRRVLEACDKTVSLPIRGHVDSLNASVAAGILMYAVMRSR